MRKKYIIAAAAAAVAAASAIIISALCRGGAVNTDNAGRVFESVFNDSGERGDIGKIISSFSADIDVKSGTEDENGESEISYTPGDSELSDVDPKELRLIMAAENRGCISNNRIYYDGSKEAEAYISNGTALYPVEFLAALYGAEIKYNKDCGIVHVRSRGGLDSFFTPLCPTVIIGSQIKSIYEKPETKNGNHYADADTIAEMLELVCAHDYETNTVKFNGVRMDEEDKNAAAELFDLKKYTVKPDDTFDRFLNEFMQDERRGIELARSGSLYFTNDSGELYRLRLTDDGVFERTEGVSAYTYDADTLYITGFYNDKDNMYKSDDGKAVLVGLSPEAELRRDENDLKSLYSHYKYMNDVAGADCASVITELKNGILEHSPGYHPEEPSGYFDAVSSAGGREAWERLCAAARPGDVILCRRTDAVTYGYNNHSALVIGSDGGVLHVFHARNAEYGVGSDSDTDYLSYDMLTNNDYWSKTKSITLYSYDNITDEQRLEIIDKGREKFKNYSFGYKYMFGYNEISCAELIRESYGEAGIKIGYNAGELLQRLQSGKIEDVVYIPDDIMLNDNFKAKAFFTK